MKILMVDDSRTSRMLFRAYLPKDVEVELFEAEDAASALAQGRDIDPDLIIMDYNMPGKNGVEIGRELIAEGVAARFVLLTANTQKAVVSSAEQAGFSVVIAKPITTEKLRGLLQGRH